jgi:hypothetical protein
MNRAGIWILMFIAILAIFGVGFVGFQYVYEGYQCLQGTR